MAEQTAFDIPSDAGEVRGSFEIPEPTAEDKPYLQLASRQLLTEDHQKALGWLDQRAGGSR
jgi:hypothetical protein